MNAYPHKYIIAKIGEHKYFWILYCEKCGHVAWYGNGTMAQLKQMQESRPDTCIAGAPE